VQPRPAGERAVVRRDVVPSTQAIAFQLADEGAADGTVVVAEHQTAGRGRQGRAWHDEAGANLLASILVRPRLEPAELPLLSYVAAIAVAEALAGAAGLATRLKWPNDVLVGGRKIAGILLESRLGADAVVVIGMGINVGQRAFPAAVEGQATSVRLEGGRDLSRDALLAAVLDRFDHWRRCLQTEGFPPVRGRWTDLSATLGREVRVGSVAGVATGLDDDGALLVERAGTVTRVVAGEISG
jgi:BirA family biotin operon repressor/biotin-[acetyl-CoA-carboxylase] ligase